MQAGAPQIRHTKLVLVRCDGQQVSHGCVVHNSSLLSPDFADVNQGTALPWDAKHRSDDNHSF